MERRSGPLFVERPARGSKSRQFERRCSLATCSLPTAGLRCRLESYYIESLLLDSANLNFARRVRGRLLFASRRPVRTLNPLNPRLLATSAGACNGLQGKSGSRVADTFACAAVVTECWVRVRIPAPPRLRAADEGIAAYGRDSRATGMDSSSF